MRSETECLRLQCHQQLRQQPVSESTFRFGGHQEEAIAGADRVAPLTGSRETSVGPSGKEAAAYLLTSLIRPYPRRPPAIWTT